MKTALTIRNGRMAACISGVELWLVAENETTEEHELVQTMGWQQLVWGRELMRRDVSVLLCAGIDRFVSGSLQGHGINVMPHVTGPAKEVLQDWRAGKLPKREPTGGLCRGRRRRRFCGGRNQ